MITSLLQSAELKYRPNYPFYWGNPLSDQEIIADEGKSYRNGNPMCVVPLDDELDRWVVPYEQVNNVRRENDFIDTHF